MKLNHLNLTVDDVHAASAFLEAYFGLRIQHARGDAFMLMRDDNGMVLTLMKGSDAAYPKTFHIGFIQESEQRVYELNERLHADGYDVKPPQRSHGLTFYVEAPGGFLVEVLALSQ